MARGIAIVVGLSLAAVVATREVIGRERAAEQTPPPPPTAARPPQQPPQAAGTAVVLGRVVDAVTERPIAGAIVGLVPATPGRPPISGRISDKDGLFVFRDVPAGRYNLGSSFPGYGYSALGTLRASGSAQPLDLAEGDKRGDIVLRLWRTAVIAGTVRDEAGEAVPGVRVTVYRRAIMQGIRRIAPFNERITDDRGMYRTAALLPGEYVVAVNAVRITALDPTRASSTAAGPATQFGSYRTAGLLMPLPQPLIPPAAADGLLRVYPTTFAPASVTPENASVIAVGAGEERAADIRLTPVPARRVSGRVVSGSTSVDAVRLRLLPGTPAVAGDALFDAGATAASADGAFSFHGVPAGDYTIHVRIAPQGAPAASPAPAAAGGPNAPAGVTAWASVPIQVTDSDVSGVLVPLAEGLRPTGRVEFDGTRPKPTAAEMQQVTLAFSTGRPLEGVSGRARADAAGAFVSDPLMPDEYSLQVGGPVPSGWSLQSATAAGRDISDRSFVLADGEVPEIVVTFTDTPTTISGAVRDANGVVDPNAVVLVFPVDRERWAARGARSMRAARVTSDGAYTTSGLPSGTYFVAAVHEVRAARWPEPAWLESVSGIATIVTIENRERRVLDLRTAVTP